MSFIAEGAKELIGLRTSRDGAPTDPEAAGLYRTLNASLRGEVRFDTASRGLYATDASNYRQPPIGVVVPRDTDDVVAAIAICREHGVPLLSRGGGTSLAGQCCNRAVVLDFSKYVHRILDVDTRARQARVEPGVVLDEVRDAAEGLTFGPDPSTHNRCTIGGMVGNNSCGVHALQSEFYGPGPRTEDNIESLDILTYDGLRMRVGPTSEAELEAIIQEGGRRGQIYRDLRKLRDAYAEDIRNGFPDIPRRVSGYNLPALLPENGFDVAKALVGSEATCVTVLEATLTLVEDFPHRSLLVLGYPDVFAAGDHIPTVRELRPLGCEGIDDLLIDYIKRKHMHPERARLLPEGRGWLLVELGADRKEDAIAQAERAAERLRGDGTCISARVLSDPEEQKQLWAIRKSGLGATSFVPGKADAWPGWEDSAVPPERVGDYLRELKALYAKYGYSASVYGHFGQGCIHTRIDFDLADADGIEKYKAFTDEAAETVVKHGGSLSGEHGDGQSRGELLPKMYSPRIMEAFRTFKAIWDPENKMNPGKVIDPLPRDRDLRLGAEHRPWKPQTRFAFPEDGGDFSHTALRCVGVGECRRKEGGVMCPSYQVTHEEMHTTRGRAHLLFEMVKGDVVRDGWKSEEVKASLDLCLACKGCKNDCPVDVDVATYKAEFLSHYYEGRLRPRQAYAFGLIHRWARIGSMVPRLANFVSRTPGLSALFKQAGGIAQQRDVPAFARSTYRRWHAERGPLGGDGRRVVLWPDTFNNHFFPRTLAAATHVLEAAGCHVVIPDRVLCCGRALYDYGMLDVADALWRETLDVLGDEIDAGTPIVGIEPSCVAAFRDELPNLFPNVERARNLSQQTFTLAEYLLQQLRHYDVPPLKGTAIFHGHCHHKSIMGIDPDRELLRRMGLDVEEPEHTCCGMAGSFGFENEKYDVSIAVGEQRLLPAVRDADDETLIVADGFSCREQIGQRTERTALHVAEVLELALSAVTQDQAPEATPEAELASLQPVQLRAHTPVSGWVMATVAGVTALAGAATAWLLSGVL